MSKLTDFSTADSTNQISRYIAEQIEAGIKQYIAVEGSEREKSLCEALVVVNERLNKLGELNRFLIDDRDKLLQGFDGVAAQCKKLVEEAHTRYFKIADWINAGAKVEEGKL